MLTSATAPSSRLVLQPWGIEDAFPEFDCGMQPLGSRVLVQVRRPKRAVGRIILADESRETEKHNTQVAKVIAVGPLAFKDRNKMTPWPEGAWYGVGDFVRIPLYGGDRTEFPYGTDTEDRIIFAIFNDMDILAKLTGDPMQIVGYV